LLGVQGGGEGVCACGFHGEDGGRVHVEVVHGLADAVDQAAAADGADEQVWRRARELCGDFVHEACVAVPDVRVVERGAVDGLDVGLGLRLRRGHDVLSEMGVGVFPGGAVLDDLVGAGGSEFGYHEPRCGGGYDDSALEVESACRVNSSEPGIAATGGENMRPRSLGEFLEPAKKVVADAS